jgi:hypothetical protein
MLSIFRDFRIWYKNDWCKTRCEKRYTISRMKLPRSNYWIWNQGKRKQPQRHKYWKKSCPTSTRKFSQTHCARFYTGFTPSLPRRWDQNSSNEYAYGNLSSQYEEWLWTHYTLLSFNLLETIGSPNIDPHRQANALRTLWICLQGTHLEFDILCLTNSL